MWTCTTAAAVSATTVLLLVTLRRFVRSGGRNDIRARAGATLMERLREGRIPCSVSIISQSWSFKIYNMLWCAYISTTNQVQTSSPGFSLVAGRLDAFTQSIRGRSGGAARERCLPAAELQSINNFFVALPPSHLPLRSTQSSNPFFRGVFGTGTVHRPTHDSTLGKRAIHLRPGLPS